jgi:hypothetical protein
MRKVIVAQTALARSREQKRARATALESDDPKVAKHPALSRVSGNVVEATALPQPDRCRARRWLERATAELFARLDDRPGRPARAIGVAFVPALQNARPADPGGAQFAAPRLELNLSGAGPGPR